ncbi:RNA-splicing factor [Dimargaris xerosporica]|nr:RNA-splicing factor [Dimargaris xerosporica]
MYNGIGLSTPRGSGTNGYVVRNLGNLRPRRDPYDTANQDQAKDGPKDPLASLGRERDFTGTKRPNAELLRHEQKRQIEVRCLALQDQLEDDERMTSEQIVAKVQALRLKLLDELERQTTAAATDTNVKAIRPYETHALSDAKHRDNARMRRALGIADKGPKDTLRNNESVVDDEDEEGEVSNRPAARHSSPPSRRRRSRSRDCHASTRSRRYHRGTRSPRRHTRRRASPSPSASSESESSDASSESPRRRPSHRSRHRHRRSSYSSSRSRSPRRRHRRHRSLSRSESRSISRSPSRSPRS